MWKAFFIALGIYALLLGAECLVLDKAVLTGEQATPGLIGQRSTYREVVPAQWAAWSLMSAGAVIMLYSFTLPQKMKT